MGGKPFGYRWSDVRISGVIRRWEGAVLSHVPKSEGHGAPTFVQDSQTQVLGHPPVSSWESEELDERPHALFLTAARKSLGSC
jgi:hypothetical protein